MTRKLSIAAVVVVLVAGAVWLFWKPAPPPPAPKVAEAPKAVAPKVTAPTVAPQVVAPTVAPAVPKATVAEATPAKPAADPQAELNTALSDIISLIQSGDLVTAFERYAPPDELAKMSPDQKAQMEQEMSTQMSQPQAQQAMQMMVTVLQSMQTQTPTLNAAGDRATYQLSDPTGQSPEIVPFSFQKIDGKWYVDSKSMQGM
jgi:hypothetical protein